jgi:hypothetical protein
LLDGFRKDKAFSGISCGAVQLRIAVCTSGYVGQDSSVRTATPYGLEDPGIDSRWGRYFPHPYRPTLGPIQLPIKWTQRLFPRRKAAGEWR